MLTDFRFPVKEADKSLKEVSKELIPVYLVDETRSETWRLV